MVKAGFVSTVDRPRNGAEEERVGRRDGEEADGLGPNEPMLPQNTIEEPEPEECEAGSCTKPNIDLNLFIQFLCRC